MKPTSARIILCAFCASFILTLTPCFSKPVELRCEYLVNPLGIDAARPRFSWRLDDPAQGAGQVAYQIWVGSDSSGLLQGRALVWNSLKVVSNTTLLTYAGPALQAFSKYYWAIASWGIDGQRTVSAVANFETGMQKASNWKGAWISDTRDVNLKPAPYFRKTFDTNKSIRSARAYIAVAGLYELSINGQAIGNHRLDPMYTRFDRRTMYVTHDVTKQAQKGKNAIGVLLGNGWYNHQSTAVWFFHEAPWRNRPTFCLDLRITYSDGSVETISSGKDWKTALSPIIFNSIYTAEHYDARLEQPNWNQPNFDDAKWKTVILRPAPSTNLVAQVMHPIRDVEEIKAKSMRKINDTTYLYDLGRNISGVVSLRVSGAAGTRIRLRHTERLNAEGRSDMSNIDVHYRPTDNTDPFQTDIFILSGRGEERFMPRFNYKGFQYVEVSSNQAITLSENSLKGYFMHSDLPVLGKVQSSSSTLDKIWFATNNSYLSNLFGYPTDCPQREKNGWTGDAHIASETGLYNFDGITVYEKWLADHRDEQQPNGVLPSIVPTSGWGYEWGNGPDWTSTIAIIPWNVYLFYGDSKLLEDCYDNIKRYVDAISDRSQGHLTTWGLGDWVPVKSKAPVELTSSIYYYVDATILAKTAQLLNKKANYTTYSALATKIKDAINAKYLNRETGVYGNGTQTEMSAPLHWGVVPAELQTKVAANLAQRVKADGAHLDVGLLGTKTILNALSDNGYADLAYQIAAQEDFPSWGWWIKNGATTLYENWPIDAQSDISMNHIMFGEIGAWYYKALGGIKPDPAVPGFKNILLNPHFVKGLDRFQASFKTPQGELVSSWERTAQGVSYKVVVPPNSSASLSLELGPGQKVWSGGQVLVSEGKNGFVQNLRAGSYVYLIK
ncbi:MAG: family 78 glycoside hydrolase catalytic domain [Haliscomenobacter sp.]|uniref:alpha-L-rhamnosidase n=1 Tax=Haliscomenobacter sp. TaxID=2717303 RepID=UPI0029BA28FE|nr:family 78 glycoside hydrolase catalytic domain [Haliscomenobacter sp.]MDX2068393.1 family 78 glycoside hydrolase catalytic domain [Haliscomenobacter sp.]